MTTEEKSDETPEALCPRCRRWQPDLDGFGVLKRAYDDLLQADHSNSVREAIRADDAARQLAAKDDLIRDAVRLIATKDDLIRALSVRTEEQSQLLSKRAEK